MDKIQTKEVDIEQSTSKPKKTRIKTDIKTVRLNIIKTNDNKIMVDLEALELILSNYVLAIYNGEKTDNDPKTLLCVKQTLSDIKDTAVLRIKEQNTTATRYTNNSIKEIEIDFSKLFNL